MKILTIAFIWAALRKFPKFPCCLISPNWPIYHLVSKLSPYFADVTPCNGTHNWFVATAGFQWWQREVWHTNNTNSFIITWLPSSNTNSISLFFCKLHREKVVKNFKVDFRGQKLLFLKFEDRLFLVKRFQIDLSIHIFDKLILKIFGIRPTYIFFSTFFYFIYLFLIKNFKK
jgi:hypothetical protein